MTRPTSSRRRLARAGATLATAVALMLPAGAGAQVVFVRDQAIWAMSDDGSDQHQVLAPDEVGTPGWRLSAPAVAPGGTTLAFEGTWGQVRTTGGPYGACGAFCTGVHVWSAGQVRRLSEPPAMLPFQESSDAGPHWTADGRVTSRFEVYTWETTLVAPFWRFTSFAGADRVTAADGSARTTLGDLGGVCRNGDTLGVQALDSAVVPDPAAAGRYLYVPCASGGMFDLVVADGTGANAVTIGRDDTSPLDAAFSPDGAYVVDVEDGSPDAEDGLWRYRNAALAPGGNVQVLRAAGGVVSSPAFAGTRIVFAAEGDIWSIAATCGDGGTPCAFPADATRLTSGPATDGDPAWTSASTRIAPPAVPPSTPAPTPTPGTTTPSPTPAPTPAPVTDRTAPVVRAGTIAAVRGVRVLTLTVNEPVTAAGVLQRRVGRRFVRVRALKVTRRARRLVLRLGRLPRGTYRVRLTIRDAAGNAKAVARTFRVAR